MPATGLLEITATLRPDDLWPRGRSDADTIRLELPDAARACRFRPSPDAPFRPTAAFEDAVVHGRIRRAVLDGRRRMSLRLEGIDAPELHYQAPAEQPPAARTAEQQGLFRRWSAAYRQPFAEAATAALRAMLMQDGAPPVLDCRVLTSVDEPGDAFDTYGRVVGQLHVTAGSGSRALHVNRWLVAQGFAFPAFYTSTPPSDRAALTRLAKGAEEAGLGLWRAAQPHPTAPLEPDWTLQFRKGTPALPPEATGPVLWPKLFRRLCAWAVNLRAGLLDDTFAGYLRRRPDRCVVLGDSPRPHAQLADLVDARGQLTVRPEHLLLAEAAATLTTRAGDAVRW